MSGLVRQLQLEPKFQLIFFVNYATVIWENEANSLEEQLARMGRRFFSPHLIVDAFIIIDFCSSSSRRPMGSSKHTHKGKGGELNPANLCQGLTCISRGKAISLNKQRAKLLIECVRRDAFELLSTSKSNKIHCVSLCATINCECSSSSGLRSSLRHVSPEQTDA